MTLGEILDLACTKIHRVDAETREEARVYASARYQMIWDSRPWRCSLHVILLPAMAEQEVIMPVIMDRVVAVRWGSDYNLTPENLINLYLTDPNRFDTVCNPSTFSVIAPSAVAVPPNSEKLSLTSDNANASFIVSVRGRLGSADISELIAIAGAGTVLSQFQYDEVISLAKADTASGLNVKNNISMTTLLDLPAGETNRVHQRLHLHSTPSEAKTQFVLFKRRCRKLVNDSDATEIDGIDNGLLAATISDLLEGQRQYSKAQMKGSESGILVQAAADLEVHQSANSIRIIPWDSFGSEDDMLPGKGYL